ncbi:MAG: response regulator [Deltaproteobacteria bacterium]|nr:response regulator [Deltaproteobacteria bacterium]
MSDGKVVQGDFGTKAVRNKVIFADFTTSKFSALVEWLKRDGMLSELVSDAPALLSRISEAHFDVCVVNLMLGGIGPFQLVASIQKRSKNPDVRIIVISKQVHKMNIQNAIEAGAQDFIAEPFENENVYNRLVYHLTPKRVIAPAGYESVGNLDSAREYLQMLLEATELFSRTEREKIHAHILRVLQNIAALTGSNRTSLIIVDGVGEEGVVLASSDDPSFYDFPLSLSKYPEILHVIHTGNFVLIDDVSRNDLTNRIKNKVRTITIGSLMVFPVRFNAEVVGVLVIRRPKAIELPSMEILRVLQALANTMAAHANIQFLLRKIYRDYVREG